MTGDDPRAWQTRVRHRLGENLSVAVVVCLLLAGAGGFVAFEEYAAPDTRTEQRVVATWTTDSTITHRATVQRTTQAFDSGTALRNRSAYLLGVAPELTATHVYRHAGDAAPATVSTNVTLVTRSVDPAAGGEIVYWQVSQPLTRQETTVSPGGSVRTAFEINVTEQRNRSRQIEAELGGTPGQIQLYALVRTHVETTLAGQQVDETRVERLAIDPRGTSYGVSVNTSSERTEEMTEPTTVPVQSNPGRIWGGTLLALLALSAAGGLVWGNRYGRLEVDDETVVAIRTARERAKFDEWISRGRVPDPADADTIVGVATLEDLVDVAIDSNRRVIEDTVGERFVVIVDRTRYVYEPQRGPERGASAGSDGGQTRPAERSKAGPDERVGENSPETTASQE